MIGFTPGEEFLVAVQRRYQKDEIIEARGLKGKILEQITHEDYREVWAYRGFNSEAISENPQYYYRCTKLHGLGSSQRATPETEVRGDQESA